MTLVACFKLVVWDFMEISFDFIVINNPFFLVEVSEVQKNPFFEVQLRMISVIRSVIGSNHHIMLWVDSLSTIKDYEVI